MRGAGKAPVHTILPRTPVEREAVSTRIPAPRLRSPASSYSLPCKFLTRQLLKCLDILIARLLHNFSGQLRRLAVFIPAALGKPIAHELLVIRWLPLAWLVLVGRPESRA